MKNEKDDFAAFEDVETFEDIETFLSSLIKVYEGSKLNGRNFFNYKQIQLQPKESFFLIDYSKNKLVYSCGFENTWGYSDDEMNLDIVLNNVHPEDKELVYRLGKETVLYAIENPKYCRSNLLSFTYRSLKKNGDYGRYLSQSIILKTDSKGILVKSMVKITDISFIKTPNNVVWEFYSKELDQKKFRERIYEKERKFFTKREWEIISLIKSNLTNAEIAEKLFISANTVATHRKNIMKKSDRHSVTELLAFCKSKGL